MLRLGSTDIGREAKQNPMKAKQKRVIALGTNMRIALRALFDQLLTGMNRPRMPSSGTRYLHCHDRRSCQPRFTVITSRPPLSRITAM